MLRAPDKWDDPLEEKSGVQANLPILRQTRAFEDEINAATTRPRYDDLCPSKS